MGTFHIRNVFLIYLYIGKILGNTCPSGLFGDICQYNCNCKNQTDCITNQIECQDCVSAYSGDTCQIENIALGKHAVQSSELFWYGGTCNASLAVDGKTRGIFMDMGCSHTGFKNKPWWYVDLGTSYRLRYLKIYNRHEDYRIGYGIADRIKGFRIYISINEPNIANWDDRELCYEDTDNYGRKAYDIECTEVMTGRFVGITLPQSGPLTLCEVEVYTCDVGWYGRKCNKECSKRHCNSFADPCDITNGECGTQGCTQGWQGHDCTRQCKDVNCAKCEQDTGMCTECTVGKYGPTCESNCNDLFCKDSTSCDMSGTCENGCQDGWYQSNCTQQCPKCKQCDVQSGLCTKCHEERYGTGCNIECERRHCQNKNDPCPIDGTCQSGCEIGYSGRGCAYSCRALNMDQQCIECTDRVCTKCAGAYYPSRKQCLSCRSTCTACHDYYECSACIPGSYDTYCQHQCSANCKVINTTKPVCDKNTGFCSDGCSTGYYGDKCNEQCPKHCLNRTCRQKGGKCILGCRDGYFGNECHQQCVNCKHDICIQESGECNKACIEGIFGRFCNETCANECVADNEIKCERNTGHCLHCMPGKYGLSCDKFCNEACASNQTGKSECDLESGTCLIGCIKGFHGTTCDKSCSRTCNEHECDQHTAKCALGCIDGWSGSKCETSTDKNVIVIIVLAIVSVAFGIIAGIVLWKWRKLIRGTRIYASLKPRSAIRPPVYDEIHYAASPPRMDTGTDTEYITPHATETDTEYIIPQVRETNTEYIIPQVRETNTEYIIPQVRETNTEYITPHDTETDTEYITPRATEADTSSITHQATEADTEYITPRATETSIEYITPRVSETDTQCTAHRATETDTGCIIPRSPETDTGYMTMTSQASECTYENLAFNLSTKKSK